MATARDCEWPVSFSLISSAGGAVYFLSGSTTTAGVCPCFRLLVVVAVDGNGRGRHPLLVVVAMRRVEDLALLSRFDAVGFDDGGFDNDVRIGIFIRHDVREGSNGAAREDPFGGTIQ